MYIKCKICGEVLNSGHVQKGGCHYDCYNKEITVFHIFMFNSDNTVTKTFYVEKEISDIIKTIEYLDDYGENDGIAIRKTTMTHGQYINLPVFQGF